MTVASLTNPSVASPQNAQQHILVLASLLSNTPALHAIVASLLVSVALAPVSSVVVLLSSSIFVLSLRTFLRQPPAAADLAAPKATLRATRSHTPSRKQLLTRCTPPTAPLLAPTPPDHGGRLTIVLDLDETLLMALRLRSMPPAQQARLLANPTPNQVIVTCSVVPGIPERLLVYLRPGLHRFLDELASFAEVVLFTASVQSYAEPLVQAIDPTGCRFSSVLYRPATVSTLERDYVKDLARLGRDPARLVLVDNNPFSFLLQPLNGVPAEPYGGCPDDRHLTCSLLPLLRGLAHLRDVRPVLESRFRMPAWFAARGVDVEEVVGACGLARLSMHGMAYAPDGATAFQHE